MAIEESNAPGLFPSIWRYRWLSLVIVIVLTALSGAAGYLTTPPVSASSTVALKNPSATNVVAPGVVGDASTARYIQQRTDFFTSDKVLDQVAAGLPDTSVSSLRHRIKATSTAGSSVITVTATGPDAAQAVALADSVVVAYRTASKKLMDDQTDAAVAEIAKSQKQLEADAGGKTGASATAAAQTLGVLQQQVAALKTDDQLFADGVDFVQQARPEDAVVPGPPIREFALGLIIGLAVASVVAWLRADRNRRITTSPRIEAMLGAPLLATLSRPHGLRRRHFGRRFDSRPIQLSLNRLPEPQYGLVAAALIGRDGPGIVAVMSPTDTADRADAALNVAMAIASDGGRVLLVDADTAARLSHRLGSGDLQGFPVPDHTVTQLDSVTRLSVREDIEVGLIAPGPHQRTETVQALREFVEKLIAGKDQYDLIVIDAPPLETSPLIPALIRASAGILAVVPRGSDEAAVAEIRRTAEIFSTPVLGYVYTVGR